MHDVEVVLEVKQRRKRHDQSGAGNHERSRAAERLFPLRCGKKNQEHAREQHHRELEDMRGGAFVGLRSLKVSADHG